MSIIIRYLLRQFIGPLFVCLLSFNGIFILFDLFGQLSRFIEADLHWTQILHYYTGVVCMYSHWFLPASCMLATLYTMWQLSHHNELTAMRASGISFHRLTLPFFLVAIIMCGLDFASAEFLTPNLAAWSEKMKASQFKATGYERVENHLYINTGAGRQWRFHSVDISSDRGFANVDAPVEITHDTDGIDDWGVRADKATYADGLWWLHNPRFIYFDVDGSELPESAVSSPPLPSVFPFPELTETPHDMLIGVRDWMYLGARDMLRILRTTGGTPEKWFDFWYSLAAPWTCIVITLFAIPAGITTSRQSVFKGVALVLITFFSFYGFTLVLEFFGQHGVLYPFLAAWLPNLVFLAIGLGLYRRLT